MVQRKPVYNHVEDTIFEGEALRIRGPKGNIGNSALLRAHFGNRKHGIGQVNADDFSRSASKRFRDIPRPRRYIQHALIAFEPGHSHQAPNALLVSDPWICGKGLGLCRERFADDVVVLRHAKILAQASAMRRLGSRYEFSS